MAAVTGLVLVKQFSYRANPLEEFSNGYHWKGPPPGDTASWTVLMNDAINAEKKVFPGGVKYVQAYGYDSDNPADHHVFSYDWAAGGNPVGTLVPGSGGYEFAGDQAAVAWWRLDKLNKRGKPIYLRKYFHAGFGNTGDTDAILATYQTALMEFATGAAGMENVHGGFRPQTYDANVIARGVSPYVTTRTLKRRGKRPPPGG